jgi:hypothetical protein
MDSEEFKEIVKIWGPVLVFIILVVVIGTFFVNNPNAQ